MKLTSRSSVLALLCMPFVMGAGLVAAQTYPTRAIRIIVPFAPGGATDVVLRLLAPRLSENLGQQVVVDNRGGGAATIGMDMTAKAAPDGYTLGVATLTFSINPNLFSKLPYNSEKDLMPVSLIAIVPLVLSTHPSVPVRSVKELIAFAKARPGSLNYSSSGNASASQMAAELFASMSGIKIVHVPYTGGGPALLAILSGQVSILCGAVPVMQPYFNSGKLIGLGVTTAKRDPAIPNIPTIAEAGVPGYESREWQGIVVPAGTPSAVISRLNQAFVKVLEAPELRDRFAAAGAHPVGSTPEEFAAHIKKEIALMGKLVKAAGIRIE